jgi:hypothetical protein
LVKHYPLRQQQWDHPRQDPHQELPKMSQKVNHSHFILTVVAEVVEMKAAAEAALNNRGSNSKLVYHADAAASFDSVFSHSQNFLIFFLEKEKGEKR